MLDQYRLRWLRTAGICFAIGAIVVPARAQASEDADRNTMAQKDYMRGTFKDYYLQGQGGDPSADYKGRVFKLSQDYPATASAEGRLSVAQNRLQGRRPGRSEAYLRHFSTTVSKATSTSTSTSQENKVRKWYGMPWMDWNTEVASDWPGTDGREFVHGLTHEFDSAGNTFARAATEFVEPGRQAYMNDRYAFGVGQVYCDPDDPQAGCAQPRSDRPQQHGRRPSSSNCCSRRSPKRSCRRSRAPTNGTADIYVNRSPRYRNAGPLSRFERRLGKVRLIQIDLQVRDDRSPTGWLLGTYGYDGKPGATPWKRMVPLGLQWGNNPDCPVRGKLVRSERAMRLQTS